MELAFYLFTPFDLLIVPGLLLGLYAQMRLMGTYNRYLRVPASSGLTGAQVARRILDAAGLYDVPVELVAGVLTDHYDPVRRVLRLSRESYYGSSISALGVAAHEAGHALQHAAGYAMMQVRMALLPVTSFATQAAFTLLAIGFLLMFLGFASSAFLARIMPIVILGYGAATLFQLVTLPVEYDASRRAAERLLRLGLINDIELPAVRAVLSAAALTYVAALVTAILELLRWIAIASLLRGRED